MYVVGLDEAGRGPLIGPVVAAAVILSPEFPVEGLDDSKKLSPKARLQAYEIIQAQALSVGVGWATAQEIDALNILQASFLAMHRALGNLSVAPAELSTLLIDGHLIPPIFNKDPAYEKALKKAIIGGDALEACISAASIVAKVTRDRYMDDLSHKHPLYRLDKHKGYPTPEHLQILKQQGLSPALMSEYRFTFKPIQEYHKRG